MFFTTKQKKTVIIMKMSVVMVGKFFKIARNYLPQFKKAIQMQLFSRFAEMDTQWSVWNSLIIKGGGGTMLKFQMS